MTNELLLKEDEEIVYFEGLPLILNNSSGIFINLLSLLWDKSQNALKTIWKNGKFISVEISNALKRNAMSNRFEKIVLKYLQKCQYQVVCLKCTGCCECRKNNHCVDGKANYPVSPTQ